MESDVEARRTLSIPAPTEGAETATMSPTMAMTTRSSISVTPFSGARGRGTGAEAQTPFRRGGAVLHDRRASASIPWPLTPDPRPPLLALPTDNVGIQSIAARLAVLAQ